MAFDGIVMANLVYEFKKELLTGRITKIAQPEEDELMLTIKGHHGQRRLSISANASLPLIYLAEKNKQSPMNAPNFCMLLRKHIGNGRLVSIEQPQFERIISFTIEHLNEMGDLSQKKLIVEIMGKHSNIIFTTMEGRIIDSIKHISLSTSSVRQVLPGRDYFIPDTTGKINPLEVSFDDFNAKLLEKSTECGKALLGSFTGISSVVAESICVLSGIESGSSYKDLSQDIQVHLYNQFTIYLSSVIKEEFSPRIYSQSGVPEEFSSLPLANFETFDKTVMESPSLMVETYYGTKSAITRIRQKSANLRQVVGILVNRNHKKYDLQLKQIKDTENMDKFRIYGELIHAYGYNLEEGSKVLEAENFYDNNALIKIPLDPTLTPQENAKKYFDKYNKQKRTATALTELIQETRDEITYLDSISNALDMAITEDDLVQIHEELVNSGYIRRKQTKKKEKIKSKPLHYLSSDGYDIYVGKNNLQNDYLTFDFATGNDWWFHAKNAPGSHVILKSKGGEIPPRAFEEAGKVAAYYSTLRGSNRAEIDYIQKKHVKKPKGGKPGFVIYHTNHSMVIDSDIGGLELV